MSYGRPYASDWEIIDSNLEYSKELNLYYYQGRVYDERSAIHNGIIGPGAQLRKVAQQVRANNAYKELFKKD